MSDPDLGRSLLTIARGAIAAELGLHTAGHAPHDALAEPAATFVTLRADGDLRGCIGTLEARRPLGVDVRVNALAAAFDDPRFAPLSVAEFDRVSIEVSLLSPSEPMRIEGEADLLAQLRPGVDGVTLRYASARATFLPQVWEALAVPRDFLAALKRKAGLPADFWDPRVNVSRYQVVKWTECETDLASANA